MGVGIRAQPLGRWDVWFCARHLCHSVIWSLAIPLSPGGLAQPPHQPFSFSLDLEVCGSGQGSQCHL